MWNYSASFWTSDFSMSLSKKRKVFIFMILGLGGRVHDSENTCARKSLQLIWNAFWKSWIWNQSLPKKKNMKHLGFPVGGTLNIEFYLIFNWGNPLPHTPQAILIPTPASTHSFGRSALFRHYVYAQYVCIQSHPTPSNNAMNQPRMPLTREHAINWQTNVTNVKYTDNPITSFTLKKLWKWQSVHCVFVRLCQNLATRAI